MIERLFVSDVAAMVGVTQATIRQHVRRGTIPESDGVDGRRRWWWRSTIEDWMSIRQKPGNPTFSRTADSRTADSRART